MPRSMLAFSGGYNILDIQCTNSRHNNLYPLSDRTAYHTFSSSLDEFEVRPDEFDVRLTSELAAL